MGIRYRENSEVFVGRDENITDATLNKSMTKLIQNDLLLSPVNSPEPKIWECRWFSDDNIRGYNKGYAVWINTEDVDEFLKSKADNIYDYIKVHPLFPNAQEYNPRSRESVDTYRSLLSGYYDSKTGKTLQPVYFLGDLSAKAQIKISTKDNNKDTPDTLSSWRDYFIRDAKLVQEELTAYGDYLFEQHVEDFHFGGSEIDTDAYADNTLKNVEGIERYSSHQAKSQLTGFDYIQKQYHSYRDISVQVVEDLSIYQYGYQLCIFEYTLDQTQVHRDVDELVTMMSGTNNYATDNIGIAIESLSRNTNDYFVDVKFKMTSADVTQSSFPWVASYDQWGMISGDIGHYNSTFTLTTLVDTVIYDSQQDLDFYIQKNNTTYYSEWSTDPAPPDPKSKDYYLKESLSSMQISTFYGYEGHKMAFGYNCWKSGYLEEFGCVECPSGKNTRVALDVPYEYSEEEQSFYGFYTNMGGVDYDDTLNLGKDSRYIVQITQMYNGDMEGDGSSEINTITNDGFSIYNQSQNTRYYMYNTRGYISRSI